MRFIKTATLIAALVVLTSAGCGKKSHPVSLFPLVSKEDLQIGGDLYKSRCAICHGAPEEGNLPSFKPLAGSAIVKGDPLPFATTILYGKGHETKKDAPRFFEAMDNAAIARIGNYVKAAANATDVPMRAKTVERAREIHAIGMPREDATRPPQEKQPESQSGPELQQPSAIEK